MKKVKIVENDVLAELRDELIDKAIKENPKLKNFYVVTPKKEREARRARIADLEPYGI